MKRLSRDEWNALRYPIELQALSEEEGGGWMAWIPMLGRGLFMVDADTAADAVRQLEELRKSRYEMVIQSGQPIPRPGDVTDEPAASGRWLQRTSKRLHAELKDAAERDGVSFNSYCENALQRGLDFQSAAQAMRQLAQDVRDDSAAKSPDKPRRVG